MRAYKILPNQSRNQYLKNQMNKIIMQFLLTIIQKSNEFNKHRNKNY